MPSGGHVWTAADLSAAGAVLSRLPDEQLPHWRDSRSSEVFARFVDPRSIQPCAQESAALIDRLQVCLQLLEGFNGILRRYAQAGRNDPAYFQQTPPLLAMTLRIAAPVKLASHAFAATLDPTESTYATRMSGLERVNIGMSGIVQGAIITLIEERRAFSDAGCLEIARALADSYPVLADAFPASERIAVEQRLRIIATTDPSSDVRSALSRWAT